MTRTIAAISLFLFFGGVCTLAQPKLEFASPNHDFGVVEQGSKVAVEFKFKNAGDKALEITQVKTTCGCTTAKPQKTVYQPGETGLIPVTFDSARFSGAITKTIRVSTNDPATPVSQLRIMGKIRTEIEISPASLTLSNIKRSETVVREITVSSDVLEKLDIEEVTSDLDFIDIKTERKDARNVVLQVTVAGQKVPAERDSFRGNLVLKTNGEKKPELRTGIYISLAKPIRVSPGSVYFFATPKGKAREMTVKLHPSEVDNLKILKVESDLEFVEAMPIPNQPGALKIKLTEQAKDGTFNGTVTVLTDLSEQPSVKIAVRGSVI